MAHSFTRVLRVAAVSSFVVCGAIGARTGAGARAWDAITQPAPQQPNIVFVLTDDLSWNLVQYMPHVLQLERQGVTFDHYIVTDSLCCPSRSSIFTGLFPHDTGVFKNTGSDGGYYAFLSHGLESKTFASAMQPDGYLTSMMGKYLNGYQPQSLYKPVGWNDWHVAGEGYPEFNYSLDENGKLTKFGGPIDPRNYLTDVLANRGAAFINQAANAGQPFLMEVATFAPHAPYTPAPRDANLFPGLKAPRTASFDKNNVNPPAWLGPRNPLTRRQLRVIDTGFRKRVQAVQAVDDLIGTLENTLAARGLAQNTYIVFSSDNGYHMGEHRLLPGKMTAFDSDIRVPLIVTGPGVLHGQTISQLAENIDLNPTFVQLSGGAPDTSVDGHSLVPLILGRPVSSWRTAALVEHHGPDTVVSDPDYENGALGGNPTTYEAIRLPNAVYVEYTNGDHEYYQIDKDPEEMNNVYSRLSVAERAKLHATVTALSTCHGAAACWAAGQPS
jgi:N-acetylglucosamine-6-sulfatase